jgi:hypothetical protein
MDLADNGSVSMMYNIDNIEVRYVGASVVPRMETSKSWEKPGEDDVLDVATRLVALSISSFRLTQCGNQLGDTVKPLTQVILR